MEKDVAILCKAGFKVGKAALKLGFLLFLGEEEPRKLQAKWQHLTNRSKMDISTETHSKGWRLPFDLQRSVVWDRWSSSKGTLLEFITTMARNQEQGKRKQMSTVVMKNHDPFFPFQRWANSQILGPFTGCREPTSSKEGPWNVTGSIQYKCTFLPILLWGNLAEYTKEREISRSFEAYTKHDLRWHWSQRNQKVIMVPLLRWKLVESWPKFITQGSNEGVNKLGHSQILLTANYVIFIRTQTFCF